MKKNIVLGVTFALCLFSTNAQITSGNDFSDFASTITQTDTADQLAEYLLFRDIMSQAGDTSFGGFINDVAVLKNVIGGEKNRVDALSGFEGFGSGFSKRDYNFGGLVDDIAVLKNVIGGEKNRANLLDQFRGIGAGSYKRGDSNMAGLINDIAVLKNVIGGQKNRIDALSRYYGIGAGSYKRGDSNVGGLINDIAVLKNIVGGEKNRIDAISQFSGIGSGAYRRNINNDFEPMINELYSAALYRNTADNYMELMNEIAKLREIVGKEQNSVDGLSSRIY